MRNLPSRHELCMLIQLPIDNIYIIYELPQFPTLCCGARVAAASQWVPNYQSKYSHSLRLSAAVSKVFQNQTQVMLCLADNKHTMLFLAVKLPYQLNIVIVHFLRLSMQASTRRSAVCYHVRMYLFCSISLMRDPYAPCDTLFTLFIIMRLLLPLCQNFVGDRKRSNAPGDKENQPVQKMRKLSAYNCFSSEFLKSEGISPCYSFLCELCAG